MKDEVRTVVLSASMAAQLSRQATERNEAATARAIAPAIERVEQSIRLAASAELYSVSVPYAELGLDAVGLLALSYEFRKRGFAVRPNNGTDDTDFELGWKPQATARAGSDRIPASGGLHLLESSPQVGRTSNRFATPGDAPE